MPGSAEGAAGKDEGGSSSRVACASPGTKRAEAPREAVMIAMIRQRGGGVGQLGVGLVHVV
jgi:hypothetical protein